MIPINNLKSQIDSGRQNIHTDSYPVSIGEVINMYRDGEIDIHPEFQRVYRWTDEQKSKLIESILLGIPLPSFFVAQREDGVWDVIDGLQRLSTIFSFLGIYKDEHGNEAPPITLSKTVYLKALEGITWDEGDMGPNYCFTDEMKRALKREKINFVIIKKESDENTKYELFQRLNSAGSSLTDQEVRNCILIMLNNSMFDRIIKLSEDPYFKEIVFLSNKQTEEAYNIEILLRFLIFSYIEADELKNLTDIGIFLTEKMRDMAKDSSYNMELMEQRMRKTFKFLSKSLGENSFRKYSNEKDKYVGAFSVSIFEVIGLGVAHNIELIEEMDENNAIDIVRKLSKGLADNQLFTSNSGTGARASFRLPKIMPIGRNMFSEKSE